MTAATTPTRTVQLFVPCLVDTFRPRVGEAMVRVLRHVGCRVAYPAGQTCCGQPALNSGFPEEAAALAGRMAGVFAGDDAVVTPSASCAGMVRDHAVELFERGPQRDACAALAGRVTEVIGFLRDALAVPAERFAGLVREPATFHYSCHMRGITALSSAVEFVRLMAGARYRELPQVDECCGFGGAFCATHPAISAEMAEQKLAAIEQTGVRLVVCNEAGCSLHLEGVARRRGIALRFAHAIELIAEGWGLMGRPA